VAIALLLVGSVAVSASAQQTRPPQPEASGEKIEKRAVTIWSDGTRMAGDLYLPKDRKPNDKLPAIVLCNGWGGTKENNGARMATRFAQNGFVALAFDYRGWGQSDSKLVMKEKMPKPDVNGEVKVRAQAIREVVDPMDEAWDIRGAISFLMGEPGVDTGRIGLWGTSCGGGLVTWVAAHDPRVKCVVAQVPGMSNRAPAAAKLGYERMKQQARGEIGPIPQTYDKAQKLRGYAHLARMVDYNAVEAANAVNVPILFIDAENEELMDRQQNGQKAYEIIKAKENVPTKYHVVKGISHYGIYTEGFEEAAGLALDWFTEHLKRGKVRTQ
jgi:dienelactone hydrolase